MCPPPSLCCEPTRVRSLLLVFEDDELRLSFVHWDARGTPVPRIASTPPTLVPDPASLSLLCLAGSENPILISQCKVAGPGGETVVTDASGQTWMLHHAWLATAADDPTVGRQLWLDRLDWKNCKQVIHGPTCTSQPGPAT